MSTYNIIWYESYDDIVINMVVKYTLGRFVLLHIPGKFALTEALFNKYAAYIFSMTRTRYFTQMFQMF